MSTNLPTKSSSQERSSPVVRQASSEADDSNYFWLVSVAIVGALVAYWGFFHYVRERAMDNLVGVLIGLVFLVSMGVVAVRHVQRHGAREALPSHPVMARYQEILEEMRSFSQQKRALLEGGLVPQLRDLIEDKLPELLERRDHYRRYWTRCDMPGVEEDIRDLEHKVTEEEDSDIKRALTRNLDIACSTRDNYRTIEKTLKLYELQIASIAKHLENLDAKLHILDLDDDIKAAAEAIVHGINSDIGDLEQALVQMETMRHKDQESTNE